MKFTCLICKEKFDNVLSLRKHTKSHLKKCKKEEGQEVQKSAR